MFTPFRALHKPRQQKPGRNRAGEKSRGLATGKILGALNEATGVLAAQFAGKPLGTIGESIRRPGEPFLVFMPELLARLVQGVSDTPGAVGGPVFLPVGGFARLRACLAGHLPCLVFHVGIITGAFRSLIRIRWVHSRPPAIE
jgi:hypothetical protein